MLNQPEIATEAPTVEPDHIEEIILRYVREESSNPYALMITGYWGCGKTFYAKEVLSKAIKEKTSKKVLYVSLNGVSSTTDVSEQLFFESFEGKAEGDKNAELKTSLIKFDFVAWLNQIWKTIFFSKFDSKIFSIFRSSLEKSRKTKYSLAMQQRH